MAGDDLQCRIFWQQACRLRTEPQVVRAVAYSDPNVKGFDDVVVYYQPGMKTRNGETLGADCFQVKFNVRGARVLTAEDLIDPKAVRRKKTALLDDLEAVAELTRDQNKIYRCILRSTWVPAPRDALAELWYRIDGSIDIELLLSKGPNSNVGKARLRWKDHLDLWDAEELRPILRHFYIKPVSDQATVMEDLNIWLRAAGLREVAFNARINPYDDLIRKLVQEGNHMFDKSTIEEVLQRDNLIVGTPIAVGKSLGIGIRSFGRRSAHITRLDRYVNLADLFDGRHVRSPDAWQTRVVPRIDELVRELPYDQQSITLDLSASHSSITFYAGYCLDTKAGFRVTVTQRTPNGVEQWGPEAPSSARDFPPWQVTEEDMGVGDDVVLALSATHNVRTDVHTFLQCQPIRLSRMFHCILPDCPSSATVRSGDHAHALVTQITELLQRRTHSERRGVLHIFGAVPNALFFFFGQRSRGLGPCQLYEYDFEANEPDGYTPSIRVPVSN